jgi:hypothetical protein
MSATEIESVINLLFAPGSVAELRIPNASSGTRSGYFNDWSELARYAALLSGTAPGVFATLNPVRQELLARSANRITNFARHTTTDADVICRRWLLIDLDPARPAGISSSEIEHVTALERAEECRQWLVDQGWPEPVFADSGNGAHLLCRVDLRNDAQARDLIKSCLEAVALQFDDELVCVDQTTYNASRISKVYGTLAGKGDNLKHRPHRISRLLVIPGEIRVVFRRALQNFHRGCIRLALYVRVAYRCRPCVLPAVLRAVAILRENKQQAIALLSERNSSVPGQPLNALSFHADDQFASIEARLIQFIGKQIRTPLGAGKLLQVFRNRAAVLLDPETAKQEKDQKVKFFLPSDICPMDLM